MPSVTSTLRAAPSIPYQPWHDKKTGANVSSLRRWQVPALLLLFHRQRPAGAQSIPLTLANEIKAEGDAWAVTNRMSSPAGDFTEAFVLDRDTLVVRKRSVHQGPVEIELAFQDNKVAGSMKMNGTDKPIAVDTAGPVFPEVSAAPAVLACLPLAEGYATAFRTFDIQKQKDKVMQLQVAGSEKVTVPAGTFDAFKVEVAAGDGGADKITVWIDKESRKPVKFASIAPEMGGATVTAELSE